MTAEEKIREVIQAKDKLMEILKKYPDIKIILYDKPYEKGAKIIGSGKCIGLHIKMKTMNND